MQFDIMFVTHLNGLLENSNFCIQLFGFHVLLILTKWIIEKVELITGQEL